VGVDVDEAGRDEEPVRVDLVRAGAVDRADLRDAPALDRDVALEWRGAGAVDDGSATDDEVPSVPTHDVDPPGVAR
jgi:hypothetical protein